MKENNLSQNDLDFLQSLEDENNEDDAYYKAISKQYEKFQDVEEIKKEQKKSEKKSEMNYRFTDRDILDFKRKYANKFNTSYISSKNLDSDIFSQKEKEIGKMLSIDQKFYKEKQNALPERDIEITTRNPAESITKYLLENHKLSKDAETKIMYVNDFNGGFREFNEETDFSDIKNRIYKVITSVKNGYEEKKKVPYTNITNRLFKVGDGLESYCDNIIRPNLDALQFRNGIYHMDYGNTRFDERPIIPVYTYKKIPYNYNPDAKGGLVEKVLRDICGDEQLKGLMQYIGYNYTKGNESNKMLFVFSQPQSGKSTLANIVSKALGNKVANLDIRQLTNNRFEKSKIINNIGAFFNEVDGVTLREFSDLKILSGDDDVSIEQKWGVPITYSREKVPKMWLFGNKVPSTDNMDAAMYRRILILNLHKKITKIIPHLFKKLGQEVEGYEWLIYNSIKAYEEMSENEEDFILQKSIDESEEYMEKHSIGEEYILKKYFISEDGYRMPSKTFFALIKHIAENVEGISVKPKNNNIWLRVISMVNRVPEYQNKILQGRKNNSRFYYYPDFRLKKQYEHLKKTCPYCEMEIFYKSKICEVCGR